MLSEFWSGARRWACVIALAALGIGGATALPGAKFGDAVLVTPTNAQTFYTNLLSARSPELQDGRAEQRLRALARALDYDPELIFQFVRNNIEVHPVFGVSKGAYGAFLDMEGTAFDQVDLTAFLLADAVASGGRTISYQKRVGTITLTPTQWQNWSGLTSAPRTCYFLANAGVPALVNGASTCIGLSGNVASLQIGHAWLEVSVNGGAIQIWDPAFKTTQAGSVNAFGAQAGYTAGAAACSGGGTTGTESGIPYLANVNTNALKTLLSQRASDLATALTNPASAIYDKRLSDVTGGIRINITESEKLTKAPLTYSAWAGSYTQFPDKFRIKIQIQLRSAATWVFGTSGVTVFADQVYGRPFAIETRAPVGTGGPNSQTCANLLAAAPSVATNLWDIEKKFCLMLRVGDHYIAAHQGTNLVTENQHNLSISIDHPYAAPATSGGTSGTYMDDSLYEFVKLASDLVILNSWGNTTEALLADLGDNLGVDLRQAGIVQPRGPAEEIYFPVENTGLQGPANNYVRHRLGATWLAEFNRFSKLLGGLGGWRPVIHRNFGIVRSDVFLRSPTQISTYPPPEYPLFGDAIHWSIGDENIFFDVRPAISVDGTYTQTQAIRKSIAAAGAGLESAVFAHVMGAVDTHSTATKFDYAAKTAAEAARTEPGSYDGPYRFYYFGPGSNCNAITALADASADRTLIHPALCLAIQEGKAAVLPGATSLGPGPRLSSLVSVTYVNNPVGACGMASSFTSIGGIPPGMPPNPPPPTVPSPYDYAPREIYPLGSTISSCQASSNPLRLYRPHPNRGGAMVAWDASGENSSHVITSYVGVVKGGGVDVTPGTIKPDALPTADEILADDVNASRAYSVDLQSGHLTYDSGPLLSVGSGPGALSFERTFKSGSRGALEPVWSHNWNIHASISSSGLEALGASRADNAVPSLVAAVALLDVYGNTSSAPSDIIRREVAGPLIMAWWQEQTTNNAITINQGSSAKTFVRKPNGEYAGPAGSSLRITTTGAPRIVERKFQYYAAQEYVASGASFEWKYDNLSFALQDASNSTTQFAYRENAALNPWDGEMRTDRVENWGRAAFWLPTQTTQAAGSTITYTLQGTENGVTSGTITNSFGRTLTFNTTSASDGTGASIAFNNTQVTLPDSKIIRYEFGTIKTKEGQQHPGTYDAQYNYSAPDFEKNEHTGYAFIGLTKVYEPGSTPGVDPAALTVSYDNDNAVASISNALGQTYTYYSAGGRRGTIKDPLAAVSSIQYDDRANAFRSTSARGVVVENAYDGIGRLLDTRTRYNSTAPGMYYTRSTFAYDTASNVIEEQMHAGTKDFVTGQTWFEYDPVNYKPIVIKRTFDTAFNVPLTETESHYLGAASPTVLATSTYSATTGLLQSSAGPSGELVTYQWTTGGQLSSKTVKLTASASTTTDYLYWPTGELKSIRQDPAGLNVFTQFAYNTRGDLTSVTDPRANVSTATYDIARRMLTMRNAIGGGQDIVYDTHGRVQQLKTLKEGGAFATSSVSYTATSRPATTTDPLGHVTSFTYDGKDRLLQVTDPDALKVRYDYWADDKVWKITKGVGTPLEQIDAQYWYNWAGAIERHRPGRGTLPEPDQTQYDVQFLFDPYGRQNVTVYPDGTYESMGFNSDGTLWQKGTRNVASPAGGQFNNIRYEYDASNRLIRKYERHEARTPLIRNEIKYEYDLAGRITREYELGSDGAYNAGTDEEILRVWDKLNRLTSETQNGRAVSYEYDGASNRTKITWPDALAANYAFDPANRLSSVNFNGVPLASYGYDMRSRRTSDTLGNGRSASYGYNEDDLLTSLTHSLLNEAGSAETVAFTFGYSGAARLASRNVSHAAYMLALTQTEQRTYTAASPSGQSADVADRYQSIAVAINGGAPQTTSLTWDPRSNLLGDGSRTFAHDFENRLESVTPTSGSAVAYDYDPTGRRVGKTVGTTETRFLLAGDEEIAEYSSAGTLLRRYIPGAGIDDRIAWLEGTGTGDIRWFHAERGNSIFATTGANGRIIQRHAYDPYGREAPGTSQTGNPWRYTGRRLDPETGLYFYRARYYDQANGRFIEGDPIGYTDQLNLYAYVGNDPLNLIDPTGLRKDPVQAALELAGKRLAAAGTAAVIDGPAPVGDGIGLAITTIAIAGLGWDLATALLVQQQSAPERVYRLYHGTDLQSALSLANGAALDAQKAANNKYDGPAGFFLATDVDSATVFALRRGRGAIVTYDITEGALAELGASGAQLQDITPGKFNTFPGYELVIPPATFGTFNRLLGNGQIKPGIVSSPKKEDSPAPSPKEKPQ